MIKGCQKNMVVLKNTGSPFIEEAYFILKDVPKGRREADDMVSEANRILSENVGFSRRAVFSRRESRRRWKSRVFFLLAGVLLGAAAAYFIF